MIQVCSRIEARKFQDWPKKAISCLDPKWPWVGKPLCSAHRQWLFDDTDNPADLAAPTGADIRGILSFVEDLTLDDEILVHCEAGISRSPAIAILILIQLGMTIDEAIRELFRIRPNAWPNLLILTLGDEILGLDEKLAHRATELEDEISESYHREVLEY